MKNETKIPLGSLRTMPSTQIYDRTTIQTKLWLEEVVGRLKVVKIVSHVTARKLCKGIASTNVLRAAGYLYFKEAVIGNNIYYTGIRKKNWTVTLADAARLRVIGDNMTQAFCNKLKAIYADVQV